MIINGKKHFTNIGGNCVSKNIIYGLKCRKCGVWYIGETGDELHIRLNNHRSMTKKVLGGAKIDESKNDCGASIHFGQKGHNFDKDAEVYILEQGNWKNWRERRQKKSYYICKFKTMVPTGMNKSAGSESHFYPFL